MTKTTAASNNMSRGYNSKSQNNNFATRSGLGMSNLSRKSLGRHTTNTAVGKLMKPASQGGNKSTHFKTAGEILNYPYSFDEMTKDEDAIALDNQLAKQQYEQ